MVTEEGELIVKDDGGAGQTIWTTGTKAVTVDSMCPRNFGLKGGNC